MPLRLYKAVLGLDFLCAAEYHVYRAMRMWRLVERAVIALLGGLTLAGCTAPPVAPAADAAPRRPPEAAARAHDEGLRAKRDSGVPDAAAHAVHTSAGGVATSARRSVYSDCDPTKKNSDGTPKRAPAGPPDRPRETIVLDYDDFGPQASASKLLGFMWWAWEGGGSWEMCDDFDVRVVVFRGVPQKLVEERYPSAKSKDDLVQRGLADYRYVEYKAALGHLDRELAELAEIGAPELARMADDLRATRRRIVDALGQ